MPVPFSPNNFVVVLWNFFEPFDVVTLLSSIDAVADELLCSFLAGLSSLDNVTIVERFVDGSVAADNVTVASGDGTVVFSFDCGNKPARVCRLRRTIFGVSNASPYVDEKSVS